MPDTPRLLIGDVIYNSLTGITMCLGSQKLQGGDRMKKKISGRNRAYLLTCPIGRTCYCVITWICACREERATKLLKLYLR